MRAIPLALATLTLLAGCIAPGDVPPDARVPNLGGEMTAKETRSESSDLCTDGLNLADSQRFCAVRTIEVVGTISGIAAMEVAIATFNGPVTIAPSKEGEWGFKAMLRARGATADDAKARLNDITFAWSHVDGATHFLDASAKKEGGGNGYAASFDVTLPRSILYTLIATTSNGAIKLDGLETQQLAAHSSNGAIEVAASVTHVELTTSNGAIQARLDPAASGRIVLTTSNGALDLRVPEDATHGYELTGTTSNGEVDVRLRDGEKGACPQGSQYYTPPCSMRTFRSSSFASRAIQSHVTLTTSNGEITASPS